MNGSSDWHNLLTRNLSRDDLNDEYAPKVWPVILFLSALMVIGILGNLLVCVVYWFDLSKVNNRFVLALAGIDLINCLISIPGDLADLTVKYSFGDSFFCPTKCFTVTFCPVASASILMAISATRFQKVCKPFGRQTTLGTSTVAIVTSILLSSLCASPAAFVKQQKLRIRDGIQTSECYRGGTYMDKIYNVFLFVLFISACLILIILYSFIWHRLRKQKIFRNQFSLQTTKGNRKLSTEQTNEFSLGTEDCDGSNDQPLSDSFLSESPALVPRSKAIFMTSSSKYPASMPSSKSTSLTSSCKSMPSASAAESTSLTFQFKSTALESPLTFGMLGIQNNSKYEDTRNSHSKDDNQRKRSIGKTLSKSSQMDKTTIMMLLVTLVFILSFLPYLSLTSTKDVYPEIFQNMTSVQLASYQLFYRCHFLNSALNPFIYNFFSLQFKEKLRSLRRGMMRKLRPG